MKNCIKRKHFVMLVFTGSSVLDVHRSGQKRASVQHGHGRGHVLFTAVLQVFHAQFLCQREHFENSIILQNDLNVGNHNNITLE